MKYYFGNMIYAKAFADEKHYDRSPTNVINNAGMSGSDGVFQTHDNKTDTMWLTVKDPESNSIGFDFGDIKQIGYMYVWNFNQAGFTGAGLKEVKIYYSYDKSDWIELKGEGYPYHFAQADGVNAQHATNLDDGQHSPINFNGISARYVKIIPDNRKYIGNWGDYIEKQHRYGLSQVRFYSYKPCIKKDSVIPASIYSSDCSDEISKITNSYGLSDNNSKEALHGNDKKMMWLSNLRPINRTLIFDLDGTYPLSEMWVWNYNEKANTGAGIKNAKIYHSFDCATWTELKSEGYPYQFSQANGLEGQAATNLNDGMNSPVLFGGIMARYVKLEVTGSAGVGTWGGYNAFENRFGISKVRFFAASGYCIEPERNFTGLLSNYNGWSGADGIFMAPIDGVEKKKEALEQKETKSVAIFSDTFIGEADPITRKRKTFEIVNNTTASFTGIDTDEIEFDFFYKQDSEGKPKSLITVPEKKEYFYWLQDCVINQEKLYAFTDNIVEDLSKMEGLQFKLVGVDRISIQIKDGKVDFETVKIDETPLFRQENNLYFGCAILPNSYEAKLPFADGYIYIYGLIEQVVGIKSLVVARVRAEDFENFSKFEFYNGQIFSADITKIAPICEEGAPEMSITPIEEGEYKGKYLFVYAAGGISDTIVCRIGDTPWGPVSEKSILYSIDEPAKLLNHGSKNIYTYNAKAHYHISKPGELLITYNINTLNFESHIKNCDIYRPRFIKIRKI
jgi:hypothetical protein